VFCATASFSELIFEPSGRDEHVRGDEALAPLDDLERK
jgi:hypothetical protein